MIRLLSVLVLILLILTLIRSFLVRLFGSPSERQRVPSRPPRQKVAGRMVKDPQCGMYVAADLAIQARTRDSLLYFCSTECRDLYAKARLEEAKR